jgi:hypothetical protein
VGIVLLAWRVSGYSRRAEATLLEVVRQLIAVRELRHAK